MADTENKNSVSTTAVKQFRMGIRIQDGEKDGVPQDFVYGFNVDAETEQEAHSILHRHLSRCVNELAKIINQAKMPKNEAL